jgi:hypothetical protein
MGLLKKFLSIFQSPKSGRNYWFYVQCKYCKEIIKGRIDLLNHLSVQYGEGKNSTSYYCRKVMIGSGRCYRPIEVEFWFDSNRKISEQSIEGGSFVTEEDFLRRQEEADNSP